MILKGINKSLHFKSVFAFSFIVLFIFSMLFLAILPLRSPTNQWTLPQPESSAIPGDDPLKPQTWNAQGNAICTVSGTQEAMQMISDGAGGVIIVWQDNRSGIALDIYAQRINSTGSVQWTPNGVAICTATDQQYHPQLCSDGAGGAIITWHDLRTGEYTDDIYAQRISAAGTPLWTANGTVVCTAFAGQYIPVICSDGAGGAILAWVDWRNSNYDIYAQRINSAGIAQWIANGVAICTATNEQHQPQLCSDGAGGAIITWQDYRSGTNYDVYAQRISAAGVVLWTTNGVAICTASNSQANPQLCTDMVGGAIITWPDDRNGGIADIYAQRIDATGVEQWTANGVAICTASGGQYCVAICSDETGNAIITWQDHRSGASDIYAQSIAWGGVVQWTTDGIAICTATNAQNYPQICSDGLSGAIITWEDFRNGISYDIYAQWINAIGLTLWTANGRPICTAVQTQGTPRVCRSTASSIFFVWQDYRSGTNMDIYVTRVAMGGTTVWSANGVAISTATNEQYTIDLCRNEAGGAIITWQDYRSGTDWDIYAQRIDAAGVEQWTANGVAICTAGYHQRKPQLCSDDSGGVIITWEDVRNGTYYDIYAQRINATGVVQWTTNGVAICTASNSQLAPQICTDGAGGAIIAWGDYRNGIDYDIYAQLISSAGTPSWTVNGVAICTASNNQEELQLCNDWVGGAFITWQDYRNGTEYDIYAQHITSAGTRSWTVNGVAVCTTSNSQQAPQICADNMGGTIIAWIDFRSGYDIYAQRISSAGTPSWTVNGVAICTASNSQGNLQLCFNVGWGAIITWEDYRSGTNPDIYAQLITVTGVTQWTANGVAICTASDIQIEPQICTDGAGGAIITWVDRRSGTNNDIYAQHINSAGTPFWTTNGMAICMANNDQIQPKICSDGAGSAIIAWEDYRSGMNWDIYAQKPDVNPPVSFCLCGGFLNWVNDQTPTIICRFYEDFSGVDVSSVQYAYSPAGSAVPTNWAPVDGIYIDEGCFDPAADGDIGWLYTRVLAVPFNQDTASQNKIRFRANDTYSNTGTQDLATNIKIDTVINAPISVVSSPNSWTPINSFNIAWTNPSDLSGIVGVYYKLDSAPVANTDGIYVLGSGINTLTGITVSGNGAHAIYVWLVDAAGNVNFSKRGTTILYLDNIITTPIRVAASPSGWTTVNSFNVTWTNPVDLSGIVGVYYKLDSPPVSNTNGTYVAGAGINALPGMTVSGDGAHTMYLWLVDAVGNIDFNTYNTTILYLDTSIKGPIGVSVSPSGWTNINSFNITWTNPSDLTGIVGAYYKLDSAPNGTAICTANGNQEAMQMISDGTGGAIIVWQDNRSGIAFDIYAQRIDSTGRPQWTSNGVAICTASDNQYNPQLCSDMAGGAIITWHDLRTGEYTDDIYAQRINAAGTPLWTANGIAICTAMYGQYVPVICSDGAGGAILAWVDWRNGNYDIYAQRINSAGIPRWTVNGVAICIANNEQHQPQICSDGAVGAIITWRDYRSGTNWDVYVQRISAAGAVQWTANGVAICTANNTQWFPQLCSDGAGGAIIAWNDYRSGTNDDIYAQRISATGAVQWIANGAAICTTSGDQINFALCSDDTGGAIIAWQDFRSGGSNIYAQRINAVGGVLWTTNGRPICPVSNNQYDLQICSDGLSGAIITWSDYRIGVDWNFDIYAQRINSTGVNQWIAGGLPICTAARHQKFPQVCLSTAGGAFIVWWDWRNASNYDIYANKIAPTYVAGTGINKLTGITVSGEGAHTIYIWLVDAMGNVDINKYSTTILYFDNVISRPISIVASPSGWTGFNSFNLTWTNPADLSGIVGAYYRLDSAPVSNTNGTYIPEAGINKLTGITVSGNGTHVIYIWLVDAVGNIDFTKYRTATLYFDTLINAPIAVAASPSSWTGVNFFNLTWTNPADLSGIAGVYYRLDSAPVSNTNGTYVAGIGINILTGITVSGNGAHVIYIWLVDTAGNIDFNECNNTTLYFDNIINAPIGVLASPSSWTGVNAFNVTWTNPADLSGIVGVYYKLDSAPLSNTNGTYLAGAGINTLTGITVSGDGAHTIYIWLVDAVGNVDFTKYQNTTLYLNTQTTQPIPFSPFLTMYVLGALVMLFYLIRDKSPLRKGNPIHEI